jgi:AcrR family transcriptional regulator
VIEICASASAASNSGLGRGGGRYSREFFTDQVRVVPAEAPARSALAHLRLRGSAPSIVAVMSDSSTTRQRRNGARREELLKIAAHVFATKGVASATVRDIAQEAGILSGSLYHHFSSKEQMVREVLASGSPLETSYRMIAVAAPNPEEALRRSLHQAVKWVARNPDVARIYRNDAQYIRETPALAESEQSRQSNRLVWIEIVEAGIQEGRFRASVDADVAVRAMWDAVLSSTRWFPPLGTADPTVIADQFAELFLGGLRRHCDHAHDDPPASPASTSG